MAHAAAELKDYLDLGRYKNGLDRCNKVLKKNPSDPRLLFYKASFLFGLDQHEEGSKILEQLCNRDPPIVDLGLVTSLDELASSTLLDVYPRPLSNGPQVAKLWDNASKASGKTDALALRRRRLQIAVNEQRWQDANTALVALKKAEPANRAWKLAHITVQQILAEAERETRVADMNRLLAYRTLKQTTIESASDLRFMVQLYRRQTHEDDALAQFEKLRIDGESAVAKQAVSDWQFARQRIELCVVDRKWAELQSLCLELLGDASVDDKANEKQPLRDDWTVWKGLVRACDELNKLESFPMYEPEKAKDIWKENRQQMIASLWVTLLLDQKAATGVDQPTKEVFARTAQAAKDYFDAWKEYPFCYDDIKEFVVQLPEEARCDYMDYVLQFANNLSNEDGANGESKKLSESLNREVNALRFEYLLSIGISEQADSAKVSKFACKAIELLGVCQSNKLPTADVCYLAVSALIRLYEMESNSIYLFQAAYLLEAGPAAEDAHPGKVLLVYLEAEIGLVSMAMKQYKSLRVREIQMETMSHSMMSRLSITHPFALHQKRQESIDPHHMIDEALNVFLGSDARLAQYENSLMESGQCDLVFELQDLRDTLAHSYTRRMLILEQARVARLTDDYQDPRIYDVRPRAYEHWVNDTKDTRDYAETFSYDSVTKEAYPERRLQAGGKIPKETWLATAILAEDVWSLLEGRDTVCSQPSAPIQKSEAAEQELLPMEIALIQPWNDLLAATQSMLRSPSELGNALTLQTEDLTNALSELPLRLLSPVQDRATGLPPSTALLRSHFLLLDLLRTAALFVNTSALVSNKKRSGTPVPAQQLARLKGVVQKAYEDVRRSAQALKKGVDARDMVQTLRQGVVGETIAETESLDKGLRVFADRAESSAVDAWDGVLKVQLGLK